MYCGNHNIFVNDTGCEVCAEERIAREAAKNLANRKPFAPVHYEGDGVQCDDGFALAICPCGEFATPHTNPPRCDACRVAMRAASTEATDD